MAVGARHRVFLRVSGSMAIGGVNPEALLCRPEGKGPFPAVVHNHGVGVDIQGYQKAVKRGYNLPAICKELATDGFLTFFPSGKVARDFHSSIA